MAESLSVFGAERGHVDVPRSHKTASGAPLGVWLHRQRALAADGRLPSDRRERLNDLGVRWTVYAREAGIAVFAAFVRKHEHGLVPHTFHTASGFPLGTWVQSRRKQWSADPHRALRLWPELVALGFVWEVRNAEHAWVAAIAALTRYRDGHGDVLVPQRFIAEDGLHLGRWVDSRRVEYRSGVLIPTRVTQLEALGIMWKLRESADDPARQRRENAHFARMLGRVAAWSRQHNDRVPGVRVVDGDGVAIGRWLVRQRRLSRQRRLAQDRTAQLDAWHAAWSTGRGTMPGI